MMISINNYSVKNYKECDGIEGTIISCTLTKCGQPVCDFFDGDWGGEPMIHMYPYRDENDEKIEIENVLSKVYVNNDNLISAFDNIITNIVNINKACARARKLNKQKNGDYVVSIAHEKKVFGECEYEILRPIVIRNKYANNLDVVHSVDQYKNCDKILKSIEPKVSAKINF